jgi:hypothetical protein
VETARWVNLRALVLKAFSLLRFFVALDKEMTCRQELSVFLCARR